MNYIATLRFKDKQGKILGFRLSTTYDRGNVHKDVTADDLRKMLAGGLNVENLKLTSDNRIIEVLVNKQEKVKLEMYKNGVPMGVYYVEGTHDTCDFRVQQRKQDLILNNPGVVIHSSAEITSAVDRIRNIIVKYDEKTNKFRPYILKNIKRNYD